MTRRTGSFIVLAPFLPAWFIDLATGVIEAACEAWEDAPDEAEEMAS